LGSAMQDWMSNLTDNHFKRILDTCYPLGQQSLDLCSGTFLLFWKDESG